MEYKVGDKVRIKSKETLKNTPNTVGDMLQYAGKEAFISSVIGVNLYEIDADNSEWTWTDDMFEGPTLFDRIKSAIIEAGKQAPIIIEQTEDRGVKISPIGEKPQPRESGIYIDPELPHVHVIFGGRIHVAVGECKAENGYTIGLQELEELKECGGRHDEEWVKEKPTVNLIINNKNTVKILRDALNIIDNKLNKED